ncbi:M28 family peptidase [Silvibacterium sp.]|uniref:M28 family peptidase n=1 Tax=Silvibacterium sp. TaxID=1964179 RepID=UPI0039E3B7C1
MPAWLWYAAAYPMRTPAQALVLLFAFSASAVQTSRPGLLYWQSDPKNIDAMVHHVPQDDPTRLEQLRHTFHELECQPPALRTEALPHGANLLCALPGQSPQTIVIAAHYQRKGEGKSAIDDWSGSMLLPFLYHALTAQPRRYTYLFIAFDGESGAQAWMHNLTREERRNLDFMVALHALGTGPLAFYLNPMDMPAPQGQSELASALMYAAHDSGVPTPQQRVPRHSPRTDDTRQFRYNDIPAILLYSEGDAHAPVPGSSQDTPEAIATGFYYDSYRLLCTFVTELDQLPLSRRSR